MTVFCSFDRFMVKLQFIGVKILLFDRMLYTRRKNLGSVSSSVSLRTPAFRAWSCLAKNTTPQALPLMDAHSKINGKTFGYIRLY